MQSIPQRPRRRLAALALVAAALLPRQLTAGTDADGPYLQFEGKGLSARWLCAGERVERRYPRLPATVAPVCGFQGELTVAGPARPDADAVIPAPARMAVLSDIHGQYGTFKRLLTAHGIVDERLAWHFGQGHLVVTGDVFDRGPEVTEALWLLYRLEQQATAAGGRVHLLLGNHEFMVLGGDLRYVHPHYLEVAKRLDQPYPALFGADSVLGQWLRQKPVLRRIGDSLYLHGGISPTVAELKLDPVAVNARLGAVLGRPKAELKAEPLAALLSGRDGPLWYRGYFDDTALNQAQVEALARRLGVRRLVVGHTSQEEVLTHHGGTVLAVDSSIKDGVHGELLLIEGNSHYRGTQDGRRIPL